MTNQKHPITPPPELVQQWTASWISEECRCLRTYIATCAAQWGADQELEACCDAIYLHEDQPLHGGTAEWLRAARRPKPPSLKEQALEQLGCIQTDLNKFGMGISTDTIRRALEQLND